MKKITHVCDPEGMRVTLHASFMVWFHDAIGRNDGDGHGALRSEEGSVAVMAATVAAMAAVAAAAVAAAAAVVAAGSRQSR